MNENCARRADVEPAIDDRKINAGHDTAHAAQGVDVRCQHGGHLVVAGVLGGDGFLTDVALQASDMPLEVVARRREHCLKHGGILA